MGNFDELLRASDRLGEVIWDPAQWSSIMEGLCRAVDSSGSIMMRPATDTKDVPRTASVDQMFARFDSENWYDRDLRAVKAIPRHLRGETVLTEQDILTPDEVQRSPIHNELIFPSGFCWWAVSSFRVGPELWGFALHRTPREGQFDGATKRALSPLARRLSETATLSMAMGQSVLTSATNALNLVGQPALALSSRGLVLDVNAAAERLFGREIWIQHRRLRLADSSASAELARLLERLAAAGDRTPLTTEPIVIRRPMKSPILIRVMPLEVAARSPFLDARVLLTLTDLGEKVSLGVGLLARTFGLTRAEAKLAALIGAGQPLEHAADRLSISPATARTQLKAVFAKTNTHRQGELVALLSRLHSL